MLLPPSMLLIPQGKLRVYVWILAAGPSDPRDGQPRSQHAAKGEGILALLHRADPTCPIYDGYNTTPPVQNPLASFMLHAFHAAIAACKSSVGTSLIRSPELNAPPISALLQFIFNARYHWGTTGENSERGTYYLPKTEVSAPA